MSPKMLFGVGAPFLKNEVGILNRFVYNYHHCEFVRPPMKTVVRNNVVIELNQIPEKGTPWQVRVYKKVLGFKRLISSDWFLDEGQAQAYVRALTRELSVNLPMDALRQRKPGWTLHS